LWRTRGFTQADMRAIHRFITEEGNGIKSQLKDVNVRKLNELGKKRAKEKNPVYLLLN